MEVFVMTSEAARMIGRSEQTIRTYERTGKLQALRTRSGRRLFKEGDVKALAGKLQAKPEPREVAHG